jgi:hypothetical protein
MLSLMRTTVTLDPDVELLVRLRMREQKVSFKAALNDAIRAGAGGRPPAAFTTEPASMGRPRVNLDRALQLAAELEDEALLLRMHGGA